MYKNIKKVMKDFDKIQPPKEEVKDQGETNRQICQEQIIFIYEKLKSFIDKVLEVYREYNDKIDEKIKKHRTFLINEKNKRQDQIKLNKLFSLISEIWISEDLGIFEICNTALLMDIYYSVLKVKKPLEVFKKVNGDFAKDSFERKIEILAPYGAGLGLMTKVTSDNRKPMVIYRGIGFNADREYTPGKSYRFGNFIG